MRYSIEEDPETGKFKVFEKESGKLMSEWPSRRAATREMGRLDALPVKEKKDDPESDEDEDANEDE